MYAISFAEILIYIIALLRINERLADAGHVRLLGQVQTISDHSQAFL